MTDAILVLGGGIRGRELPEWVRLRADKALELFTGKEFLIPSSAFSVHVGVQVEDGWPIFEADVIGEYLLKNGAPAEKILSEPFSLDTIGNAFFTRMLHCEPRKLRKLTVITSEFHMPRSKEVFEWVFRLAPDPGFELAFVATPDAGLSAEALRARKEKEERGRQNVRNLKQKITALEQLHEWLYTVHDAYAFGKEVRREKGDVLRSY